MIVEQKINDTLVRHYSDAGVLIRQVETGALYSDAVDVVPCRYSYQETNTPVEQGGSTVTEPSTGQTGAEMDPIDAVAGMSYVKDKYYRDPTNKEVYLCTVSVAYAGLPHEAVNVYFNWGTKRIR